MSLIPSQCRAGRALLGWSQDELAERSRIAKKSIADFERGVRQPHDRTMIAVRSALEAFGVMFIPENGGGAGVRLRLAMPRLLFRRDEVEHRQWIAFAFDYKSGRHLGFVDYQALAQVALANLSPIDVFDRDKERILLHAAEMIDRKDLDPEGRVLIKAGDLTPVEFDSDAVRSRGEVRQITYELTIITRGGRIFEHPVQRSANEELSVASLKRLAERFGAETAAIYPEEGPFDGWSVDVKSIRVLGDGSFDGPSDVGAWTFQELGVV